MSDTWLMWPIAGAMASFAGSSAAARPVSAVPAAIAAAPPIRPRLVSSARLWLAGVTLHSFVDAFTNLPLFLLCPCIARHRMPAMSLRRFPAPPTRLYATHTPGLVAPNTNKQARFIASDTKGAPETVASATFPWARFHTLIFLREGNKEALLRIGAAQGGGMPPWPS